MPHESAREEVRIVFAGGGTGGHIYMGKVLAEAIRKKRRLEVLFIGTGRGLEDKVLQHEEMALDCIDVRGLKGKGLGGWVRGFGMIPRSLWQSSRILRRFNPHLVVGLGGYSAGPVLLEASWKGISTLIIEPNVIPGMTNRWLKYWVDEIVVAFDETRKYFGSKCRVAGIPIRKEFFAWSKVSRDPESFRLLVLGGSQGSRGLNRKMTAALPELKAGWRLPLPPLKIVHQSGESDCAWVSECYRKVDLDAEVRPFIDDMPQEMGKANLVVARSGAGTIGELGAGGRAALLIPFPQAADRHQLKNAQALARTGAAQVLEESALSVSRLSGKILELASQKDRLEAMEESARRQAQPHAAEEIAEIACVLVDRQGPLR